MMSPPTLCFSSFGDTSPFQDLEVILSRIPAKDLTAEVARHASMRASVMQITSRSSSAASSDILNDFCLLHELEFQKQAYKEPEVKVTEGVGATLIE